MNKQASHKDYYAFARDLHSGIAHSELFILQGVGHLPQMQASAKVAKIILKDCALREE